MSRSLESPPKLMVSLRRRFRGRSASPENLYSIHVSLQLVLLSHSGAAGQRFHRWHKVSLGEMGGLTDGALKAAWLELYGAWAWATDLRQSLPVEGLLQRPVPSDTSAWFSTLSNVPAPRTVADLWQEFGFDPKNNTDFKARRLEVERYFTEGSA